MWRRFKHRQRADEWMDSLQVDPAALEKSLRFIRRINHLLGYTRAIISHLEYFSRTWRKGQRIDIIDLATGSADVPRAILRWADRRGFDVQIIGVELHPRTIASARRLSDNRQLQLVHADVLQPPFADRSFDYALCTMFLHHLDDTDAVRVLQNMNRLARRGIIASDLLRHRRAYVWIRLLTLASNAMVRHDAAVSIRQSFSQDEVMRLRHAAGLDYAQYHRHFAHRWVLAGERPEPIK